MTKKLKYQGFAVIAAIVIGGVSIYLDLDNALIVTIVTGILALGGLSIAGHTVMDAVSIIKGLQTKNKAKDES